jgi:amino-acid N-acetyltransferase
VSTVNLCHPADVAEELLTYAGAGTCVTLGDWTRVQRVGVDDFSQVAELIQRGVEEGYLKARDDDAVARLVVNGYGAVVGDHHLAGFAALLTEPYAPQRVGELCALTTISRFAGGGVGAALVQAMLADAADDGLRGVFACTAVEAAARFFIRMGFAEVAHEQVPAAKWADYDPARRLHVRAFLHDLGGQG